MDVVQKKLKASASVQACRLCLATLSNGCSRSVTCPCHARGSCCMGADDGRKELAKRGRQLHKGVTCASVGLVGAVKVSIDHTKYPRLAV